MEIKEIPSRQAVDFLLPRHYSGRKPQITVAFGLFDEQNLVGACTFGKPASNSLCIGVCGEKLSSKVYELNRLCIEEGVGFKASRFVSFCLRQLKQRDWIIVSYSDTGMHHNGYIYQACNFFYTGQTKQRTDKWTEGNKHSRHYSNESQGEYRKVRTAKNRYVYFATSKGKKRNYMACLNYPILPYPKQENKNYTLGEFQKTILVKVGER